MPLRVPETMTCVDCGGQASLISYLPDEDELEEGMTFAYRCADCLERFDVVLAVEVDDEEAR